jgi:hypothetical protein
MPSKSANEQELIALMRPRNTNTFETTYKHFSSLRTSGDIKHYAISACHSSRSSRRLICKSHDEILSIVPPTEQLDFHCEVNPRIKLREKQLLNGMVWLAMYDEDILCEVFKMKIAYCKENIVPY